MTTTVTTVAKSTITRPGLLDRLRTPAPAQVVEVSFTGTPAAVSAAAWALASVTVVTGMRHTATADDRIRLDVTCYPTGRH